MNFANMGRPTFDEASQEFICKKSFEGEEALYFRKEPCIGTSEDIEEMYCIP